MIALSSENTEFLGEFDRVRAVVADPQKGKTPLRAVAACQLSSAVMRDLLAVYRDEGADGFKRRLAELPHDLHKIADRLDIAGAGI